jgi:Tfp pilus assembly protein PilE
MQKGFTLFEMLIYVAITAAVGGLLTAVLVATTKIQGRQTGSAELNAQLNFISQTLQRLVRGASQIEMQAGKTLSYLRLRRQSDSQDPTTIVLNGTQIDIKEGSSATTTLTAANVSVTGLEFTKFTNYPGHDSIQISVSMTYSAAGGQTLSKSLTSAIARISAATFDSTLSPGSSNTYDLGASGTGWRSAYFVGSTSTPAYSFSADTNTGITSGGADDMISFVTGGTVRGVINKSGYVGIGTTSPSLLFHLAQSADGTVNVLRLENSRADEAASTNEEVAIRASFGGKGGIAGIVFGKDSDYTYGANQDSFISFVNEFNGGTQPIMRLTSGGNVGIGDASPDALLDVQGTTGTGLIIDMSSGQNHLVFETAESRKWVQYLSGNNLLFWDSIGAADRVTFQQGGNVGIGTTSPGTTLGVTGELNVTGGLRVGGAISDRVWAKTLGTDINYAAATTILSLTFTTHGGRVTAIGKLYNSAPANAYTNTLELLRGGVVIDTWKFWQSAPGPIFESAVVMVTENLPAGTYTYSLNATSESGTRTAKANWTKLTVFEL